MPKRAQIIPPDAYPPLMRKAEAAAIARRLRSPQTAERGARAIAAQGESLRQAVGALVDELEKAGRDDAGIAQVAHEIRGLGENAGLAAAGHIADGLCRYFDAVERLGLGADPAIVELHVRAILHAARHEDEAGRMGDTVAKELAALVSHKLTEINTLLGG